MKSFVVMTTKNEADRYLEAVLAKLQGMVDEVFIYDDESTDGTVELAESYGATVCPKLPAAAGFMEDESEFRSDSYTAFASVCKPDIGDWVISLDADEMLVSDDLDSALRELEEVDCHAYSLKKAEVFSVVGTTPYIRLDGYWGDIETPRLFRWMNETEVPPGIMGCGSIPKISFKSAMPVMDPMILHYGYASEQDRITKYARYFGVRGHNPKHIQSILKPGMLIKWPHESLGVTVDD